MIRVLGVLVFLSVTCVYGKEVEHLQIGDKPAIAIKHYGEPHCRGVSDNGEPWICFHLENELQLLADFDKKTERCKSIRVRSFETNDLEIKPFLAAWGELEEVTDKHDGRFNTKTRTVKRMWVNDSGRIITMLVDEPGDVTGKPVRRLETIDISSQREKALEQEMIINRNRHILEEAGLC